MHRGLKIRNKLAIILGNSSSEEREEENVSNTYSISSPFVLKKFLFIFYVALFFSFLAPHETPIAGNRTTQSHTSTVKRQQ